jgi:hypothetical protein
MEGKLHKNMRNKKEREYYVSSRPNKANMHVSWKIIHFWIFLYALKSQ